MWKFVKPRPTPAKVVSAPPKKVEVVPPPSPEPIKEEEKEFSFYKKEDAGSDLIEQLRQKEAMRAELAATVSKTMTKYK